GPVRADSGEPAGTLKRAERTRALHPGASLVPEPTSGATGLAGAARPTEPLRPHADGPALAGPMRVEPVRAGPVPARPANAGPERRPPRPSVIALAAAVATAAT